MRRLLILTLIIGCFSCTEDLPEPDLTSDPSGQISTADGPRYNDYPAYPVYPPMPVE